MKSIFKSNKKIVKNTIYDIIILSIISIMCIMLIHLGLKVLLHINTKTITDAAKAMASTKHNVLYISIMFIAMFIFSFIICTVTTLDQIRDKTINRKNYKQYTVFIVGFIILINTLIGFISSLIINARLTNLCNSCEIIELSFYTYQLQRFISVIKLLCWSYVIWSTIAIIVVLVILDNSKYDNSLINKIKKVTKKLKVSRKSKVIKK